MTYQEFKSNIIQTISAKLGSAYRVTLQDIIKNNDTHLDGLTILSENSNISPTIYLNYYYEQYTSGKSLPSICEEILHSYYQNAPGTNIDISFFTDFEKVKSRVIFKLVNYERNKELLKKVPHVRYLDLALIFNCFLDASEGGCATILIYHHHLSFWNISAEELYSLAKKNTPKLLRYQVQNIAEVIMNLFSEECNGMLHDTLEPIPMYVLSNHIKLHGSGCMLYEDLLSDISAKMDSDFYILPSSIHEVLLIPVKNAASYTELVTMVKEINSTQLTREEILSDCVYLYSRHTGKITM